MRQVLARIAVIAVFAIAAMLFAVWGIGFVLQLLIIFYR